jgi:hypothetical protein
MPISAPEKSSRGERERERERPPGLQRGGAARSGDAGRARRISAAEAIELQNRAAREAARKGLAKPCPPGTIARRAHYRRAEGARPDKPSVSKLVPPTCVPDPLAGKRRRGELGPGRAPKGLLDAKGRRIVIKVEPGRLEKHGYGLDLSDRKRREALRKAVESEGRDSWLSIFRRLVLLSTWNKRKSPERSVRARSDAEYLKTKYRPASNAAHI